MHSQHTPTLPDPVSRIADAPIKQTPKQRALALESQLNSQIETAADRRKNWVEGI